MGIRSIYTEGGMGTGNTQISSAKTPAMHRPIVVGPTIPLPPAPPTAPGATGGGSSSGSGAGGGTAQTPGNSGLDPIEQAIVDQLAHGAVSGTTSGNIPSPTATEMVGGGSSGPSLSPIAIVLVLGIGVGLYLLYKHFEGGGDLKSMFKHAPQTEAH